MVQVVTGTTSNYILDELRNYDGLSIDIESTGLEFPLHRVIGVGVVGFNVDIFDLDSKVEKSPNVYYFPVAKIPGKQMTFTDTEDFEVLAKSVSDSLMEIIGSRKYIAGHNLKFDLQGLRTLGLEVSDDTYLLDTLPCFRFISESGRKGEFDFGLNNLMKTYLGEDYAGYKKETTSKIPSVKCPDCKRSHLAYYRIPFEELSQYCGRDALAVIDLFDYIWTTFPGSQKGFAQQYSVTKSLYEIECQGMPLDPKYITDSIELLNRNFESLYNQLMEQIDSRRDKIEQYCSNNDISTSFLEDFQITNNNQIHIVMTALGYETPKFGKKTKKPSWKLEVLVGINDPIAALLVVLKKLSQLRSTYINKYSGIDVVYPTYNNGETVTGRLSAKNPNVQNIPAGSLDFDMDRKIEDYDSFREYIQAIFGVDTKLSHLSERVLNYYKVFNPEPFVKRPDNLNLRSFIVPRDGYKLVSIDYKQLEVCVLFFYMRNKELLEYVRSGGDVHDMTTKLVFNKDKETDAEEFEVYRKQAKAVTFGIIYGQGNWALANKLGLSLKEGKALKEKFMQSLPGFSDFMRSINMAVYDRAREHGTGWLESLYQRKYYLTEENMYMAVNRIVQGSAGEFVNAKFVEIHNFIRGYKSRAILLVHDEILFEIHESELFLIDKLRDLMVQNKFGIPLSTDVEISHNSWGELSKTYTKELLTKYNSYVNINNESINTKDGKATIMENEVNVTPTGEEIRVPRTYNISRKITVCINKDFLGFEIGADNIPANELNDALRESYNLAVVEVGRQIAGNDTRVYTQEYYKTVAPVAKEPPAGLSVASEAPKGRATAPTAPRAGTDAPATTERSTPTPPPVRRHKRNVLILILLHDGAHQ